MEEVGCIGFEEEEAEGAVRECVVGVVGIVPMLQGGQVPVYSSDEGVAGIVALGEG